MSERDQVAAWTILELLRCLETPPHDPRPVADLARSVDPDFAICAGEIVEAFLSRDEQLWADLLSRLSGRYRFLSFFPSEGFRVDLQRGQRIDLFERFKRLSPFADADLWFVPSAPYAEVCEGALSLRGWSSAYDDFVFVVRPTNVGFSITPVWLGAKLGSPGADVRDAPLAIDEHVDIFV